MTLIVLALDGVDARLVDYFDIGAYSLGNSRDIETFTHNYDFPYTLEIWPTVATGVEPSIHGIGASKATDQVWNNPILQLGSWVTSHLDSSHRARLGNFVENVLGANQTIPTTDIETFFDQEGRVLLDWPGVQNGNPGIQDVWNIGRPKDGRSIEEFEREMMSVAAKQLGWVCEMLHHNTTLIGTHVHVLDMCSHIYSNDEPKLRRIYERVGWWIEQIQETMSKGDDLLILSDHGVKTAWTDTPSVAGDHSMRAYATTTIDDDLFQDVFTVRDWIENHISLHNSRQKEEVDIPEQKLRDLGYI